jgi:hypothetical protein
VDRPVEKNKPATRPRSPSHVIIFQINQFFPKTAQPHKHISSVEMTKSRRVDEREAEPD